MSAAADGPCNPVTNPVTQTVPGAVTDSATQPTTTAGAATSRTEPADLTASTSTQLGTKSTTVRPRTDTQEAASPQVTGLRNPVTNQVRNPAPHHTTPHHTTKNYSQQDHGTAVRGWQATESQRSIDPLTALAATIGLLRPDWRHDAIRATLARTGGSWHDIARRALTVALDPTQRTPLGIENADMRRYDTTPTPPTLDELVAGGLLPPRREAP